MDHTDNSDDITDKYVFLRMFQPKNFGRISPLVYIFWLSLFSLIIGLMFYQFLIFIAAVGGFIFLVFALFIYIWVKNEF